MRIILHIDFNSYFASVEQQANPRLRGKPVGVTGGDRTARTVLGAASVEARKFGVKTGMQMWEAKKLCPSIILIPGDSDKYLEVTKRFLTILKDYSPYLEVFSIDEAFLEVAARHCKKHRSTNNTEALNNFPSLTMRKFYEKHLHIKLSNCFYARDFATPYLVAQEIKSRIHSEIGEWITCSIGISYNKLMAKLAGSLQKPDGLVVIPDQKSAIEVLDKIELDEICGIGPRIKKRLFNMGVSNFKQLRNVPLSALLASFKSYGQTLYDMARGIDERPIIPFYEKPEVKSVGHRYTINHDTNDSTEIKQILLKLTELVARRLRAKKLVGKTVHCWYREALIQMHNPGLSTQIQTGIGNSHLGGGFIGDGMQVTVSYTNDGLEIFQAAWKSFHQMWTRDQIRMIGVSISNLKPQTPQNLSFLEENKRKEVITAALDKINDKFGEFTLQRAILLQTPKIRLMPNPFLADRRFKI